VRDARVALTRCGGRQWISIPPLADLRVLLGSGEARFSNIYVPRSEPGTKVVAATKEIAVPT
jgi:hypothetical protein